ncbi:MAG: LemA family protein [Deltaproteobacteria bacterium]|jgi:LemA protein|nr:LemA family protein [Deltaproteobacteria bacterium]
MNKAVIILIPLVILGVLVIGAFGIYNGLVSAQEEAKTAWSQVENQYQRRADLIPNLVETVKGFATQEKTVLEEVTRLRSQWGEARQTGDINKSFQAAQGLDSALSRLMVVVERYPELKSNQNFMKLQDQLEGTENRVSVERRRFNETVLNYNRKIRTFPGALLAGIFGFERMPLFEAEPGSKKAPQVKF